MSNFFTYVDDDIYPDEFQRLVVYWLNETRKSLNPKTIRRHMTSAKKFANYYELPSEDLDKYRLPTPPPGEAHPLPEGIEGIYAMLDASDNEAARALVVLCGLCGLRVGEARLIRASNIDINEMKITVRGKGDKTRIVPISVKAWQFLCVQYFMSSVQDDAPLVGEISDRQARRLVTVLGREAGLRRAISSHDLRATFATGLLKNGANVGTIQKLLGHSNINTTQIYLGVSSAEMREAVNLL